MICLSIRHAHTKCVGSNVKWCVCLGWVWKRFKWGYYEMKAAWDTFITSDRLKHRHEELIISSFPHMHTQNWIFPIITKIEVEEGGGEEEKKQQQTGEGKEEEKETKLGEANDNIVFKNSAAERSNQANCLTEFWSVSIRLERESTWDSMVTLLDESRPSI